MRGSAPEWSCGQGVPRVNRTVQTRVVLDALVSNKTFGNATSAPTANFLTRSKTSNKIEGSLVSTGTTNELRANRSQCARTSLSILTYPLSRSLMLERREKLKHFFNAFLTGHWPRAGSWYLRGILRRSFCGEAYSIPRAPAGRDPWHAWGVVQLVGHLTVNEDGEGSNPSAPAKFSTHPTRYFQGARVNRFKQEAPHLKPLQPIIARAAPQH